MSLTSCQLLHPAIDGRHYNGDEGDCKQKKSKGCFFSQVWFAKVNTTDSLQRVVQAGSGWRWNQR